MVSSITDVMQAIRQAGDLYHRLVLLAGPQGVGKTAALQTIAKAQGYPLINVNLQLCKAMLELTRSQRTRQVERLFKAVVGAASTEVVLLDNLEVLFDPGLEVEPLRFLLNASRNQTLVAAWNGTFRDGTLTYAEPGHPEFAQYKQVEALVVPIEPEASNA
jgi:hypothetical protein